jgi:hypothetical protein
MIVEDILISTLGYKALKPEAKKEICNGCGSAGAKFDFIPDTIYGLNITEVCNIHDYDYHVGETEEDRRAADHRFLNNLMIIINMKGGWLRWFRRRRALKYYEAVRELGSDAFWAGKVMKNTPSKMAATGYHLVQNNSTLRDVSS